jgi:hypothetical protein
MDVLGKDGKTYKLWKLVRCKSIDCRSVHNRDENATKNMHYIVRELMKGKERPEMFTRTPTV